MNTNTCDGSNLGVIRHAYMSLPSPNISCEEDEKKRKKSWQDRNTGNETEGEDQESSVNLQARRGALVPPKTVLGNDDRSGRESSCSK